MLASSQRQQGLPLLALRAGKHCPSILTKNRARFTISLPFLALGVFSLDGMFALQLSFPTGVAAITFTVEH